MKKIIILTLSLILLISNFGLSICLAQGDMPNPWDIDSYTAFADVKSDGSMVVEEYVTYNFSQDFSGIVKRKIDTYAASGVDQLSIYNVVELNKEDISSSKLELIQPDSYKVILDKEYDMLNEIDISLDTEDRQRTLVFKYTLNDLVGIYSDMALLDWSFIDKGENHSIGNISINVNIPKDGSLENIHSFLQGPLYSQQANSDNTIVFEARQMDKDRDLKLIMLLPTSVIPEGRKKIDNEITQEVLSDMEEYEKEIEIIRKEYETRQLIIKLLTYITAGIIVAAVVYLFWKHDKDPKVATKLSYMNELPADYYTPAELGVLMNRGKVRPDYIVATLIDLVNRGYLNIESAEDGGFMLSKNPDAKTDQLKGYEEYLLVWIFDDFGQGSVNISTKQFEEWIKDTHNKKRYKHKYKTWENLVIRQASKWKFFENVGKAKIYGLLIGILTAISGIVVYILGDKVNGIIVIALSLLLMIYSQTIRKRTEFGAINNAQWIAFKNYLKGASRSNLPKPELDAWERFLAYAIPINRTEAMVGQLHKVYGDNALKNKRLFLLHKDNLDKTFYWINSTGRENKLKDKLLNVFSFSGSNSFTIDKKG